MNVSEEDRKKIKSQRDRELDELRRKGLAKPKITKLKDCKKSKRFQIAESSV